MNFATDEHSLLRTPLARKLYHEQAANLPIIDFHSHLSARDLADDRVFATLTELWITPDPYKHRALRQLGVPERVITGDAPDEEKFNAWAAALPRLIGHPLHPWSAIELARYFDIGTPLSAASAPDIWHRTRELLVRPTHTACGLLGTTRVACVCTSDRFLDPLDDHRRLAGRADFPQVLPSLRADDALAVQSPEFPAWVRNLGEVTGTRISRLADYFAALEDRLDAFAAHGCLLSDHGLDTFEYTTTSEGEAERPFRRALEGGALDVSESRALRSYLLAALGASYARRGWAMQLHLGAQRETSSRLRDQTGPTGGYATIGQPTPIPLLCRFLDDLERRQALPRMLLYPLHPGDYAPLATLTGSFTEEGVAGKLQCGPAWWFNDHLLGMRQHLDALSHYGCLSTFVGMTTDSRSLLSMTRHEYFRRILCDYLGEQAAAGRFPDDYDLLADYVRRIAYDNARTWLRLPLPPFSP